MGEESARVDRSIADLAARQHGVVSMRQLSEVGLGRNGASGRARSGRLHRVHRGVYAVGHAALSMEGRFMAAVLAQGRSSAEDGLRTPLERWGAVVSHRSAAELWGLLQGGRGPVDVTVSGYGGRKRRAGIRIHRSATLEPALVTTRSAIPVTTPSRTLADLRRVVTTRGRVGPVTARDLRRAVRQAEVLGLPLGEQAGDRTRSDLERLFLRICRRHRLPVPEVNVRVGRHLVDFLWREARLVVETDGYRYHRGRTAFEDDRARDVELMRLGHTVIRLSEKQLEGEPEVVARVVREAVSRSP